MTLNQYAATVAPISSRGSEREMKGMCRSPQSPSPVASITVPTRGARPQHFPHDRLADLSIAGDRVVAGVTFGQVGALAEVVVRHAGSAGARAGAGGSVVRVPRL